MSSVSRLENERMRHIIVPPLNSQEVARLMKEILPYGWHQTLVSAKVESDCPVVGGGFSVVGSGCLVVGGGCSVVAGGCSVVGGCFSVVSGTNPQVDFGVHRFGAPAVLPPTTIPRVTTPAPPIMARYHGCVLCLTAMVLFRHPCGAK